MSVILVELVYGITLAALGILAGCWLCRRSLREVRQQKREILRARQTLACLGEMTTRVATDVGEHRQRVTAISDELAAKKDPDAETVVATVVKLVKVNQHMQQRLAEAETKLQEQSQALQTQTAEARTDVLTRLPNRRALEDESARRLAEYQRHGTPFSVVLLDVDRFKRFNDQHGHQVGDEVLQGIAEALRQNVRGLDMAARYGGEEFVVTLPRTALDGACEAGEHCRQAIENAQFQCGGKALSVTVSVGVAQLMAGEPIAGLLQRADQALYASKQAGRNSTHWHDGLAIHPLTPASPQASPAPEASAPQEVVEPQTQPRLESKAEPVNLPKTVSTPAPAENGLQAVIDRPGESLVEVCDRTAFLLQVRQKVADWKRGGPSLSVMLIRIDDYDQIVRRRGRALAEDALRATQLVLGKNLRQVDLVGHYSPACFAILLPDAQLADVTTAADRVRERIAQRTIPANCAPFEIAVSVGIAALSEGDDVMSLLRRAERAMSATGPKRTCYRVGPATQVAASLAGPATSGAPLDPSPIGLGTAAAPR